jgi:hypothetical protein
MTASADKSGMRYLLILFFVLFSVNQSVATTLMPVPLSRLMSDADAVVEGVYRDSITRILPNGELVTEVSLRVKRIAGLNPNDIYNPESFKVYFPGGTYNNRVVRVQSAPSFLEDEHVLLFVEKRDFGFLIQNLSLGKFNYQKRGGEKEFFTSSVFPQHNELGHVSIERIEKLVKERFNHSFSYVGGRSNNMHVFKGNDSSQSSQVMRSPASINHEGFEQTNHSRKSILVIFIILGILIFVSFLLRRKCAP